MNAITSLDQKRPALRAHLEHKINNKTKPLGSLGRIEALAIQLGMILGSETPVLTAPQMIVCAADHGLAARGVSLYPSDVTWQMVENFLAGGAAVSVLARLHGIALNVVDCGVNHDFSDDATRNFEARAGLLNYKIAHGTADAFSEPAMSISQCEQAVANGREIVQALLGNAVLLGEMGIGNTSAASLLMARLTGLDIAVCTGAGTGLDEAAVVRKTDILRQVLARHADAIAPREVLASMGGFEIATLAGIILQAAAEGRVIVVDGFIASAAVLVASRMCDEPENLLQRCVFAHRSGERGHQLMLEALNADPLLDLGLRLGEGSGAALAWPLLQSACVILNDMASFEAAGVSRDESN